MDGNNAVITESNGDATLGPESGEMWAPELDTAAGNPSSLGLEEKAGLGAADQGDDVDMTGEGVEEERLLEHPLKEKHNYERLSPQSQLEGTETDPPVLETIYIAPLDGSQAELRTRIIKEVRKPGRSKCELARYIARRSFLYSLLIGDISVFINSSVNQLTNFNSFYHCTKDFRNYFMHLCVSSHRL